jgi:hypothetical protein
MDAYAVTLDGRRLRTMGEWPGMRLEDDRYAATFKSAEKALWTREQRIDAGLAHGSLCISANSSAVNHLLWAYGARPDAEDCYPAAAVALVGAKLKMATPDDLPAYVRCDKSAMRHAIIFVLTCAKLGLGIEIST